MGQRRSLPRYDQRFRALFEQTHDSVFLIAPDGVLLAANQRGAEMLGYTVDEIVGLHSADMIAEEEREDSRRRAGDLLRGESVPLYERTFVRKQGGQVSTELDVALIRDEDGEPLYFQSIARDISERKRAERAMESIFEGISGTTGRALFPRLVSHLAQAMEVRHAFVAERIGPTRVRVIAATEGSVPAGFEYDIAGTPCEAVLRGETIYCPTDVQSLFPTDRDLQTLEAESYMGIPFRDESGDVTGHLVVIHDLPMTDAQRGRSIVGVFAARAGAELNRLRAESALHASESKYRTLVEQVPAITYVASTEPGAGSLWISPQVEKVLGYTPHEWCADANFWIERVHDDDRASVLATLESSASERDQGEPIVLEYRMIARGGRVVWIRDQAVAVGGNGSARFYQGVMIDITVFKQLEEERLKAHKLESVGQLAGGIAHDFNNLLMAILGNISLAKVEAGSDQRIRRRLKDTEKAIHRAAGLTQQLLAFSKGGAPIRKTSSVAEVTRETIGFNLSGSDVHAEFRLDEALWPADVDTGQLSQVLENLTLNAVQAMPDGGRIVVYGDNTILGKESNLPLPPGRYVRLAIEDHGIGIQNEHLGKIFDPYFTTKETGSGLGLYASYVIVRNHDGHLGVESAPGHGATFTIHLPASERPGQVERESEPLVATAAGRILVMDDEELVRRTASLMLSRIGYDPDVARDGAQALRKYRAAMNQGQPFDAVILDLTVPGGMGGKPAVERLLRLDPAVKAIVSSGYSSDPIMSECQRHGFRGCIAKPYALQDLESVLRRVLQGES